MMKKKQPTISTQGVRSSQSWLNQKFDVYLDPNYYDQILPKYKFGNKTDETILDERLKNWVDARGSKFKLALELGCGTGRATSILARYCEKVVACDLSPTMLKLARNRIGANDNFEFVHSEMAEFIKKNQSIVRKSDLVVSFWALHYTLSAEFADKDETSHKFDARNPDVALVNCMDKLANLFDGVPPKSKFIFFHFDPFSEEQKISLECWEKIVPLPFGKQTASLYVLKKFFEERSDIDSKIEKIGGISPMQTLDRALETYMNFHLHTLFNHSEYRTEVMELLIRRLEKYSKTNFNIPAGTIIFSGEKAAHTRNTHHIGVTAVSDYVQVIEKLLRTHLDGVFTPELKFEEVASTFDKNVYLLSLIKKPKWRDDALIFKIDSKDKKTNPYVVKIHEDKYPLASHIYNDVALIDKISGSGHAAKIIKTFSIVNADIKFRVVIYDYLNGSSLASLLQNATEQQILELRRELKHCVGGLLKLGVNVFVRDLSDFHVISNKKDGILKIVLTDFNAILDCSNSDEYSRVRIMDIIDSIIDKLVSPDYKPFNSHRPMMIDLRF